MDTGTKLKLKRTSHGISQEYLASKIGVSRQTISNWENNRTLPNVDNLLDMAKVYNISIDQLFDSEVSAVELPTNNHETFIKEQLKLSMVLLLLFILTTAFSHNIGLILIWLIVGFLIRQVIVFSLRLKISR
ncbi:helix-turn-helix transcriptional regulator [Enterococcus sp. LJL90]